MEELHEDQIGRRILAPLATLEPGPSGVDIQAAMATARQRRRTRRIAGFLGAGAATALVLVGVPALIPDSKPATTAAVSAAESVSPSLSPSQSPAAIGPRTPGAQPQNCTGELLPFANGRPEAIANAIDPSGKVAVGRNYPGPYKQVFWHDGTATPVALPGEDPSFGDITTRGVAVGGSFMPSGKTIKPQPWIYQDGRFTKLPGVKTGWANAINDNGVIVGEGLLAGDTGIDRPLIWRTPTSSAEHLSADSGRALDIDQDGTVVGEINDTPWVWPVNGSPHELTGPTGQSGRGLAAAVVNGWASGNITVGKASTSVRWDLPSGTATAIPQIGASANAVTAAGWVGGWDTQGHPAMTDGVHTLRLDDLLPRGKYALNGVTGVSLDGTVLVGTVEDGKHRDRNTAAMWRCH